jgi:tetratricopeptide (TPR) repeat protein
MNRPAGIQTIQRSSMINKGYLSLSHRLYDHAFNIFSDLLIDDPNDYDALVGLASVYQHTKKTEDAIKTAYRAVAVNPELHPAYDVLAEIFFINKDDYGKAEEFALKSLEIQPYDSSTYSLLAQIYYFQRRFDDCQNFAIQALMLDPENYVAHMALGLYYYSIPNFQKAEEHYKACLKIAPNSSMVYGNYALLNMSFARNRMGYKLLREALSLSPDDKFLQESFREAYIRNNPFYAPLYWVTDGKIDDVYIIYGLMILMLIAAFSHQIPFMPEIIKMALAIILLFSVGFLLTMVFYRLFLRFIINRLYNWSIKRGKLVDII